ncbi:hypothetical protein TPHA_0K00610 [Tetrapisispora phaffii CBS 4417]|uniref:FAD-binding domain-containing protein n=1 Tax=Tetrapisispora phaffii (strain ATCC 24235 / CBS 4417 / NBRC 1672 / NRRL Y-8282 / UCD 70-5) TaxID=1071381 RepID=G8BZ67_TETPH|nr:hypothetical protein TPHA_0K00610 [Tetrapisispora phaffii CBS 4417]CCE65195.1 hypothetical protein TPHA_0K00610 [Tetrapisispora phaffii CBS 4417]
MSFTEAKVASCRITVGVIGAGPVGLLTALMLSKRGYIVTIFDYRDLFDDDGCGSSSLRSINLALSNRGISSIRSVDAKLCDKILQEVVPMKGRMIHDVSGSEDAQLYGIHGECINSIGRALLNHILMENVKKDNQIMGTFSNITIKEKHKLLSIKFSDHEYGKQLCSFQTSSPSKSIENFEFDFVMGCDGSYSQTRSQIAETIAVKQTVQDVDRKYVELRFEPNKDGSYIFSENYLHIWPRDNFMLIALPNNDGSFTATFFASVEIFHKLMAMDKDEFQNFITSNFEDVTNIVHIDVFMECLYQNSGNDLNCRTCYPYHVDGGKALLLGDAAHSMVPFYGQGLNCGFEDVKFLQSMLDQHNDDRNLAFRDFSRLRVQDHLAIIDMSKRNYFEMSHDVVSNMFIVKKCLDNFLHRILKDYWIPQYTMVTFRDDISYSKVEQLSNFHKKITNIMLFATGFGSSVAIIRLVHRLFEKSSK